MPRSRSTVALAVLLVPSLLAAQGAPPVPTGDLTGRFESVQPSQPTETPGRIEVLEIFWYGCPHCFAFLPVIEAWQRDAPYYVEVRRMPAILRESGEIHARAFYTADLLDALDRVHRPLFEAIHVQGRAMDTRESLRRLFLSVGVDAAAFDSTFDSFAVDSLVQEARLMQVRYGVRGTPTVIVNGRYRVSAGMAGGYQALMDVVAALIEREHEAHTALE